MAPEPDGKVGIGVADHAVIFGGWPATDCRLPVDAPRGGCGAEENLLPRRVDVEEHGAVERAQRVPRAGACRVADHDALGGGIALTRPADGSRVVEGAVLDIQ